LRCRGGCIPGAEEREKRIMREVGRAYKEDMAQRLEITADGFESGEIGWSQGKLHRRDRDGNVVSSCLVGGLSLLGTVDNYPMGVLMHLAGCSIAEWNDEPGRTVDDVIDLLRRGAKEIRNTL